MDNEVTQKLDELTKYVPFIDFLLEIDKEKYIKFIDIKKWIITKKRYPLKDLQKIEQSIITQYKNIILDNRTVPPEIALVFSKEIKHEFINLCDDSDEEDGRSHTSPLPAKSATHNTNPSSRRPADDSDDEVEIISVTQQPKKEPAATSVIKEEEIQFNQALDDTSIGLLQAIDGLGEDDNKIKYPPSPPNSSVNDDEDCDAKCSVLFTRREGRGGDRKTPLVKQNGKNMNCESNIMEEPISLDSSDDEMPQTSNGSRQAEERPPLVVRSGEKETQSKPNISDRFKVEAESKLLFTRLSEAKQREADIPASVSGPSTQDNTNGDSSEAKMDATKTDSTAGNLKDEEPKTAFTLSGLLDSKNLDGLTTEELLSSISKLDNKNSHAIIFAAILKFFQSLKPDEQATPAARKGDLENAAQADTAFKQPPAAVSPTPNVKISQNKQTSDSPPPPAPSLWQSEPAAPIYPNGCGTYTQPIAPAPPTPAPVPNGHDYRLAAPLPVAPAAAASQRKVNMNDPRIRNLLNKLQNSPLLTPMERQMAANMGQQAFMPPLTNSAAPNCIPNQMVMPPNNQCMPNQMAPNNQCMPNHMPPNQRMPASSHFANQMPLNNQHFYPGPMWANRPVFNTAPNNIGLNQCNIKTSTGQSTGMTYGEYKRKKEQERLEKLQREQRIRQENERKRLELAKKRQEEEQRRQKAVEDAAKRDSQKQTDEIRSILMSTLEPHATSIATLWKASPTKSSKNAEDCEKVGQPQNKANEKTELTSSSSSGDKGKPNTNLKQGNGKAQAAAKSKQEKTMGRTNRLYKELECTVKGFDQLSDYIPMTIGGRRRSSVHARSVISEQLKSLDDTDISSSQSTNDDNAPSTLLGKRRTSINSRSAMLEQLTSQSEEEAAAPPSTTPGIPKRRRTICEQLPTRPPECDSEDEVLLISSSSSRMRKKQRIADDDVEDLAIDGNPLYKKIIQNQPWVKLTRLSEDEIKSHQIKRRQVARRSNILSVQLIASKTTSIESENIPPKASAPAAKNPPPPKRLNNDCEMTENNTTFCALCRAKPQDLTNHYVQKHKTESYISRLTWSHLDDLCINTPFAKAISSGKSTVVRYKISCPFCEDELNEPFMNLYNHYSTHTGEYAYQCSECQLAKPYRADIQSHQLHSKKSCRKSQLQILYRYPTNAMVIYLYYCTICNFVQLNEANILKHLREQHGQRQAIPRNVKRCILAAISDGPEEGSGDKSKSPTPLQEIETAAATPSPPPQSPQTPPPSQEVDNILVRNEAGGEDDPFDTATMTQLNKQLGDNHTESPGARSEQSMTVIHAQTPNSDNNSRAANTSLGFGGRHIPILIKDESIEIEEKTAASPLRPSVGGKIQCSYRSVYRDFPNNVKYLGLYKCLADDCYYSTDSATEFQCHLEDHRGQECITNDYLQCAYCISAWNSPQQLVQHIEEKHQHMIFQCSLCCYRSCEPYNVVLHQKENHYRVLQTCQVYKYTGVDPAMNKTTNISEKIAENVQKLSCIYCSNRSFYNTNILESHIRKDHKIDLQRPLKYSSCIYCPMRDCDENLMRKHVALKHPEELPYLCSHNNAVVSINEDFLHNLQTYSLNQTVSVIEVEATLDAMPKKQEIPGDNMDQDIKPNPEELLKGQEDIVKTRLRKLTQCTGVAPDSLYHCPELTCGGFFSNYDLWLRHMRVKHLCMECNCPHCKENTTTLPLAKYSSHFEEHLRHTYICFHCPATFRNQQEAMDHAASMHKDLGHMRLEQIRFNISYSYFVIIQKELLVDRTEFMAAVLNVLNERIAEMELNDAKSFQTQWLVKSPYPAWLEEYKIDSCRLPKKKCFCGNNCDFTTTDSELLHKHVRESHKIEGNSFTCNNCDFTIARCQHWDEVIEHIQLHSDSSFFICGACFALFSSRPKISQHTRDQHAARDVPLIKLAWVNSELIFGLAIVFANECLSFSTMRNCFCCEESGMKSDAFVLHLTRYHNFALNYYCEWCNYRIESLQLVEQHYRAKHRVNKLKIRCELASKREVGIVCLNNFQISLDQREEDIYSKITIKEECADDSVILLEDDDIVVENYAKKKQELEEHSEKPRLKCIAVNNLMEPQTNSLDTGTLRIPPHLKLTTATVPNVRPTVPPTSSSSQHVIIPTVNSPQAAALSHGATVLNANVAPFISISSIAAITQQSVANHHANVPNSNIRQMSTPLQQTPNRNNKPTNRMQIGKPAANSKNRNYIAPSRRNKS
ncbi:uncharacterized protein LOC106088413 [Stomoxys calcitrans]|uniref:uncharacterized protein LOC106088413 n=1 Tax=Stomoxys calcitrans TaxID=35570 RepID=UPI0027E33CD7|nr:uncharacterized protein LOC106088413 [Stomoxys calcitrans]XP_059222799.1 uncharacterized protein LOC106088413 [Stomoxys calcitrans]